MLYTCEGDTLIRMYPSDDTRNVDSTKCNIDKYVRIK